MMKEPGWRPWTRNWRRLSKGGAAGAESYLGRPATGRPSPGSESAPPPSPMLISPSDIDLLARLVRAEAEGEPYEGQVAVAAVVLNRLKSPLFPSTVRGVIYEARQFDTVSNGRISTPAEEIHIRAVRDALSGADPSDGALYFFSPEGTKSAFMHSLPVSARIGGHVFSRHPSSG